MKRYTIGAQIAYIRGIVVLADENLHLADRQVDNVAARFKKQIRAIVTASARVPVCLHVVATESPILPCPFTFEHDGQWVSYSKPKDPLKDLALVKYCSCGVRDRDGGVYHVLNCLRHVATSEQGRPGDIPLPNWLVALVTTDAKQGMRSALDWLASCAQSQSWVVCITVPKASGERHQWTSIAAQRLGEEVNRRFSHCTLDGWALAIPTVQSERIGDE